MSVDKSVDKDVTKLEDELQELKKVSGRISYVEPNDIALKYIKLSTDKDVKKGDNLIIPNENLNMFVDFQVMVPTPDFVFKKGKDGGVMWSPNRNRHNFDSVFKGTSLAYHSLSDNMMTTNYTEATYTELRKEYVEYGSSEYGKKGVKILGNGTYGETVNTYSENLKVFDKGRECLCVRSITIKYNTSFYPVVTIEFVDVRGFALMMPTDLAYEIERNASNATIKYDGNGVESVASVPNPTYSVYKTFFQIPNPRYLLTVKGYYGKPITYSLCLSTLKCSFDSANGDFIITCKFIGYMYGIFADLPFNLLVAAPYISSNLRGIQKEVSVGEVWQGMSKDQVLRSVTRDNDIGPNLLTYIQFINKMANIKSVTDRQIQSVKDRDTTTYNMEAAMAKANTALGCFSKFTGGAVYPECKPTDTYYDMDNYWLTFLFHTKIGTDDVKKEQKVIDEIVNAFDDLLKLYPKDNLNEFGILNQITTIDNGNNKKLYPSDIIENIRRFRNFVEQSLPSQTSMINDGMMRVRNPLIRDDASKITEDQTRHGFIEFNTSGVDIMLNAVITGYQYQIQKKEELYKDYRETNFKTEVGFTPCVRNFYRMFFAHMSCFMETFWRLIKDIQGETTNGERKYTDLIAGGGEDIGTKSIDRNVPKDITNYNVAPFPAVYKVIDGKNTLIYPGEDEKLKDILECKYVESIYNSIVFCQGNVDFLKLKASKDNAEKAKAQLEDYLAKMADDIKKDYEDKIAKERAAWESELGSLNDGTFDTTPPPSTTDMSDFDDGSPGGSEWSADSGKYSNEDSSKIYKWCWTDFLVPSSLPYSLDEKNKLETYGYFFLKCISMVAHSFRGFAHKDGYSPKGLFVPSAGLYGYQTTYDGRPGSSFIKTLMNDLRVNKNNFISDLASKIVKLWNKIASDDVCGIPIAFDSLGCSCSIVNKWYKEYIYPGSAVNPWTGKVKISPIIAGPPPAYGDPSGAGTFYQRLQSVKNAGKAYHKLFGYFYADKNFEKSMAVKATVNSKDEKVAQDFDGYDNGIGFYGQMSNRGGFQTRFLSGKGSNGSFIADAGVTYHGVDAETVNVEEEGPNYKFFSANYMDKSANEEEHGLLGFSNLLGDWFFYYRNRANYFAFDKYTTYDLKLTINEAFLMDGIDVGKKSVLTFFGINIRDFYWFNNGIKSMTEKGAEDALKYFIKCYDNERLVSYQNIYACAFLFADKIKNK